MSETKNTPSRPELLAPAGNWDCVRAAVENGADAIYFGLDCGFNARARADNFSVEDLPDLMEQLHCRNVKGYVTLNTLAFPKELAEVERLIRCMAESDVDALLVQDIGVARLAKQICPELALHASTQMTMTSAECIDLAKQLDIERVVVARELSIGEIRAIRDQTDMPIETFVHGALCVAYSGQCLTSESLGGRSANRGQCAQACRLSYDLISDGIDIDLGDMKYLLSPQDLAAYELTPELLDAGVCSLKIEGRLKTPEYVANITRHYREAIDLAMQRRTVTLSRDKQHEMEMSFSRGFSPGWLQGCDHKMLVPAKSSAKRGVMAGTVKEVRGNKVMVDLHCSIAAGDGVVFDGDRINGTEQGGRIFGVFARGARLNEPVSAGSVALTFAPDSLELTKLESGQQFWKTDDPKLNQRLRKTYDVSDPVRRVALDLQVWCEVGKRMRVVGNAVSGASCVVHSDQTLEPARKHAISETTLREQLGRLGGTVFELRNLEVSINGEPMCPFSVLGQVRRAIVEQLEAAELKRQRTIAKEGVLDRMRSEITVARSEKLANAADASSVSDTSVASNSTEDKGDTDASNTTEALNTTEASGAVSVDTNAGSTTASDSAQLRFLCRTAEQLQAAAELGLSELYVEFQDIRDYGEAVATAHANGCKLYVATPRIQKPDEMGIFRSIEKHQADGILIRNFAGLRFFQSVGVPFVVDFSMNVANELTAEFMMQTGAERLTASYDLNRDQLFDLVKAVPTRWLEVVIHQHMPMFHMEHCVFCAVLSPGTNKTNCGRPCDVHKVELRDRIGMEHPLTADVGCRNTLYNAVPQSSAEIVHSLLGKGVRDFRVEFLREDASEVAKTVHLYQSLLKGDVTGNDVWLQLKATNRVGVTRGTLEERNPLAII